MEQKLDTLRVQVKALYDKHTATLLFHGWHHIQFVAVKAKLFAESVGANQALTEASALVHDLNYIVEVNSEPEVGAELRATILSTASYSVPEITQIESIIMEAHTATRGNTISLEGKALSDADTLFKALPITPILFASRYITQNKVDIARLAHKVVSEQQPLFDNEIYFYTDLAKEKYLGWAKANLQLWANVEAALEDTDVKELITTAYDRGVL